MKSHQSSVQSTLAKSLNVFVQNCHCFDTVQINPPTQIIKYGYLQQMKKNTLGEHFFWIYIYNCKS